ncbi:MAG TPA: hypothetical protein VKT78_01095 [Fimbriimonadaceae bacterium]|nr:hypothetical protein [Fimbriimonadaceae bacterium]
MAFLGLLGLLGTARASVPPKVLECLERAHQSALRIRAQATVKQFGSSGPPVLHQWAYDHGKEYLKTLTGPIAGNGRNWEALYDGSRGYVRAPQLDQSGASVGGTLTVIKHGTPFWMSPIQSGYAVPFNTMSRFSGFLVEVAGKYPVAAEFEADGHLVFHVPGLPGAESITLRLNPKWDYMLEQEEVLTYGVGPGGAPDPQLAEMTIHRVAEARKLGGWVPTKIEVCTIRRTTPPTAARWRVDIELTDIKPHVSAASFKPIGRPGDKVVDSDASALFIVGDDGKMQRATRQAGPVSPLFADSVPINVQPRRRMSDPGVAQRIALAVAVVIVAGVLWFFFRSRRNGEPYWGPPRP